MKSYLIVSSLVQASAPIKARVLLTIICVHKAIPPFKTRFADAGVASISVDTLPIISARVRPCAFIDVQLTPCTLIAKRASAGELMEVAVG